MDLDIEMGDAEHDALDMASADDILQPDEPDEPGEVVDDAVPPTGSDDFSIIVPTKIHIRGLDTLHTEDIKAYVKAHFGPVDRVEWIDDVSANLVFSSEPAASEAMVALSSIDVVDATALSVGETLPAKPFDGKPDIALHVRFALKSDRKEAGAAARSRYYLLHPEHDPEERRRRQHDHRARYRDRDGELRRNDRRRRGSSNHKTETFEASMYDDAPSHHRRYSDPEDRGTYYASDNRGKELFRDRASRRDRSASPQRERDDGSRVDLMARSSRRNRDQARAVKARLPDTNHAKELFPAKSSGRSGQLDQLERSIGCASLREEDMPKVVAAPAAPKTDIFRIRGLAGQGRDNEAAGFSIKGAAAGATELFPDRLKKNNAGKELLDTKRSKPRQKAQDLFS